MITLNRKKDIGRDCDRKTSFYKRDNKRNPQDLCQRCKKKKDDAFSKSQTEGIAGITRSV